MDKPWLQFYEPGVPDEIAYPAGMLLHHILDESAARFPGRPATILPIAAGGNLYEGRLSYRDLERSANRFANALIAMGVQKGDRVASVLPNSPQFLIAYFGALKVGAIAVPLDPGAGVTELEEQLIDSGAETVIATSRSYAVVKQVQPNTGVTRVITTQIRDYAHPVAKTFFSPGRDTTDRPESRLDPRDYSLRLLLEGSSDAPPQLALSPDDLAALDYGSAARGAPGAAALTHRNLVANCLQTAAWRTKLVPGREAALCLVPFSHLYSLQVGLLNVLCSGGALILYPALEPAAVVMGIDKYRPTLLPVVPSLFAQLLNLAAIERHNLRSFRFMVSGEGALAAGLQDAVERVAGVRPIETYGIAETGPLTHAMPPGAMNKQGSIGVPLPGTLAQVVDPGFPLLVRAPGEPGVLAVKGPQIPLHYWNRPGETLKVVDGWLITDELARMDEDGFFYIERRRQDLLDAGDYTLFSQDVEEV